MQKQSNQVNQEPKKKLIQKMLFAPKIKNTKVINVKVKFLRQQGYKDFLQWSQQKDNVYIGRNMTQYISGAKASKWANPYKVQQHGRQGCIKKYKQYILNNKQLMNQLPQLKGKTLGCWCKPESCHGDVLVELIENYQQIQKNIK